MCCESGIRHVCSNKSANLLHCKTVARKGKPCQSDPFPLLQEFELFFLPSQTIGTSWSPRNPNTEL